MAVGVLEAEQSVAALFAVSAAGRCAVRRDATEGFGLFFFDAQAFITDESGCTIVALSASDAFGAEVLAARAAVSVVDRVVELVREAP